MKTWLLVPVFCVSTFGLCYAPIQDASSVNASPELKVSLVLPETFDPFDEESSVRGPTLINQLNNAHFSVVIENISDQPLRLRDEPDNFWLELIETDGKILQIRRTAQDGSRRFMGVRLSPGELLVKEVFYITAEQSYATLHHTPPGHPTWSPEFPFVQHRQKSVTLCAVFEEPPTEGAGSTKEQEGGHSIPARNTSGFWRGKVTSAPRTVILDYP